MGRRKIDLGDFSAEVIFMVAIEIVLGGLLFLLTEYILICIITLIIIAIIINSIIWHGRKKRAMKKALAAHKAE